MRHRRHGHPARVNFRQLATVNHEPIDRVAYKLRNYGVSPPPTDMRQSIENFAAAGIRGTELVNRVNNSIEEGKWSSTFEYIKREYPRYLGSATMPRKPRPRRLQKRPQKRIPHGKIERTQQLRRAAASLKKNPDLLKTLQQPSVVSALRKKQNFWKLRLD